MPSRTVENYLKCIFIQQQKSVGELVPMGQLATAMKVMPGTATAMIQALADAKFAEYESRQGVRLTDRGNHLALQVLRRHRLVEQFLVQVLNLDWSMVHEEAEELEHAISDRVLERIDQMLGRPMVDPHGDPIPDSEGQLQARTGQRQNLVDCEMGKCFRVARVLDQDPDFLRFVDRNGLTPGVEVMVQHREAAADSVTLLPAGLAAVTLGTVAARKILVESADSVCAAALTPGPGGRESLP